MAVKHAAIVAIVALLAYALQMNPRFERFDLTSYSDPLNWSLGSPEVIPTVLVTSADEEK